jgi:hypothetical protein
VVILEVLGGTRSPTEAAEALGLSVTRYYALEATALDGLSRACEPRPAGKREPDPAKELARLAAEKSRLEAENARFQSLLRSLQRTVGVKASPPSKPAKKGQQGGKRRRRKTTVRALVAAKKLRDDGSSPPVSSPPSDKPAKSEKHVAAAAGT